MCVYNNDCKLMSDSCNSGIGKDGYFNEQEESKDNKMKDRGESGTFKGKEGSSFPDFYSLFHASLDCDELETLLTF